MYIYILYFLADYTYLLWSPIQSLRGGCLTSDGRSLQMISNRYLMDYKFVRYLHTSENSCRSRVNERAMRVNERANRVSQTAGGGGGSKPHPVGGFGTKPPKKMFVFNLSRTLEIQFEGRSHGSGKSFFY